MGNNINRRSFIKQTTFLGAAIASGGNFVPRIFDANSNSKLDLSVVEGEDYFASTVKSIEMLGGINKFISKGSRIGLLVNSRYDKPGTYVKPEITLAVLKLCREAGAKEIVSLENVSKDYWRKEELKKKYADEIALIKNPGWNFTKIKIPNGVALKEAEVQKAFLDCDAFINIAIFKDHEGVKITGTLKNLMGLSSQDTNKFFHFGSKAGDWYADPDFLAQCIADINLIKKPVLCIGDATEFITTNGPFGPGNVLKQKKVIAAHNTVSIDSYGAKVLGFKGNEILAVKKANELGLGEWRLDKLKIKEISI